MLALDVHIIVLVEQCTWQCTEKNSRFDVVTLQVLKTKSCRLEKELIITEHDCNKVIAPSTETRHSAIEHHEFEIPQRKRRQFGVVV